MPGATAFTLMPKNAVSRAEHFTSMFNIDIDVECRIWPGWGVNPALQDKTVIEPLVIFRNGVARDISWKEGLTFKFIT
jgi:hypothetical protein